MFHSHELYALLYRPMEPGFPKLPRSLSTRAGQLILLSETRQTADGNMRVPLQTIEECRSCRSIDDHDSAAGSTMISAYDDIGRYPRLKSRLDRARFEYRDKFGYLPTFYDITTPRPSLTICRPLLEYAARDNETVRFDTTLVVALDCLARFIAQEVVNYQSRRVTVA